MPARLRPPLCAALLLLSPLAAGQAAEGETPTPIQLSHLEMDEVKSCTNYEMALWLGPLHLERQRLESRGAYDAAARARHAALLRAGPTRRVFLDEAARRRNTTTEKLTENLRVGGRWEERHKSLKADGSWAPGMQMAQRVYADRLERCMKVALRQFNRPKPGAAAATQPAAGTAAAAAAGTAAKPAVRVGKLPSIGSRSSRNALTGGSGGVRVNRLPQNK